MKNKVIYWTYCIGWILRILFISVPYLLFLLLLMPFRRHKTNENPTGRK